MAPLDLTGGLLDIDADSPAGPNLELDPEFGELERAATGTPERQYGETIIPAVEPEWKDVAAKAEALLERTRDLRVLVHLAVARLHLTGLPDYAGVVRTIRALLETRWGHVHPQLDPEDDNDPTLRANALLRLGDPALVLRVLRTYPLAASRREGAVSWRTIGISTGAIESDAPEEKKSDAVIRAAFADSGAETVGALCDAVRAARRDLTGITAAFDANCGFGYGPDFEPVTNLLHDIQHYLEKYAPPAATDAGTAELVNEEETASASPQVVPGAARPAVVTAASLTSVDNRADALRLLDVVCRYYEDHEPSSPLPLLIQRARNLADKNFLEILKDLAPDGVGQAQMIVQSREP